MEYINFEPIYETESTFIEIKSNNIIYDLHNGGEFLNFNYNTRTNIIKLSWLYYIKGRVSDKNIEFSFLDVLDYSITNKDIEIPIDETNCLFNIKIIDKQSRVTLEFGNDKIFQIICSKIRFNLADNKLKYILKP
ncbi:MAG: hypothetical protein OEZ22_14980 [Spirochaetia bacterium]|nr:hypothetical protein [Spirochaetia bacterium]